MEVINDIITIATPVFTIIGFLLYGRRLNKLTIKQAERAERDASSANIVVEPPVESGNNKLRVKNVGCAAAEDVNVSIDPDIRAAASQFPFPMRLESGQSVFVSIHRSMGGHVRTTIKVSWKDPVHPAGVDKTFDTPLFS